MLEKLLSNASIKNKTVAQYQFKSSYHKLANVPKNANIELLCGEWDDVRAYRYKAKRAAILIYTHFRKEFGLSIKHIKVLRNHSKKKISLKT